MRIKADDFQEAEYPISQKDQEQLWQECWTDAQESGAEYVYIIAKTQALFSYRVGVLSDQVLDHDMMEVNDDELAELLKKDEDSI